MAGHKRSFPYYSEIDDFEIKRPAVGVNPSQKAAEPRTFEPRAFDDGQPHQVGTWRLSCDPAAVQIDVHAATSNGSKFCGTPPQTNGAVGGTDFTSWTDDQLKARQPGGSRRMIIDPPVCRLQYLMSQPATCRRSWISVARTLRPRSSAQSWCGCMVTWPQLWLMDSHPSPAPVRQQPAGCLMMRRPLQVAKARECEANTGPAGAPQAAGGADAAQEVCMAHAPAACARAVPGAVLAPRHQSAPGTAAKGHCHAAQEDDPLEAYMNAVQQEVAQDKPTNRARPGLEMDEQDNVAEYLEARHQQYCFQFVLSW